ncbi:MAG: hypothetical protein IJV44_09145 [Prevotella sp.]|nr:hypothetical protein [Prevotella sp.]
MEMKAYKTPEMEVVEMKHQVALLAGSGEEAPGSGTGFSRELDEEI